MKILFLSHKVPYPPNKGDRIPTFYRMQFLSKRHKISLAFPCFYEEEMKYVAALKEHCVSVDTVLIRPFWAKLKSLFYVFSRKPLTLPYFYSRRLHERILRRIRDEKFDLIYVYSSSMAQYVFDVNDIKKIIDLADADSHKWLQYAKHTLPPLSLIYYLEWFRLKRYEEKLARAFDQTIAISDDEKKLFATYIKDTEMDVVTNGVDLDYFKPSPNGYDPKRIIFVGAMDYFANVDAVLYFYRSIFPMIKREMQDVRFYIVGSNPTKSVRRLIKDKNVTVTGFVKDVRPYLERSSVCVIPLRIARGIQNKILEAMASGVPVVTTTKGNGGINAKDDKSIIVKDNPREFAQSVIRLIKDKELRDRFAYNARKFVEGRYDWRSNLEKLEDILVETYKK